MITFPTEYFIPQEAPWARNYLFLRNYFVKGILIKSKWWVSPNIHCESPSSSNLFCLSFRVKVGVHLKAVFPPLNLGLMRMSRSRFKQSKNPLFISQILGSNLCFAVIFFFFFWGGGGYFLEEIVFLKQLVKFGEIRNIEDLICF